MKVGLQNQRQTKMKLLIVTLCVLAALIPAVLSFKCYTCDDEMCAKQEHENCPSSVIEFDTCMTVMTAEKMSKSCTTSVLCEKSKQGCKENSNCEIYCCDSDLCNGGVPLKPVTLLTLLAMTLGVAKYLM